MRILTENTDELRTEIVETLRKLAITPDEAAEDDDCMSRLLERLGCDPTEGADGAIIPGTTVHVVYAVLDDIRDEMRG